MSYPYQTPRLPGEFRMAAGGFGRMAAPFIAMLAFFFLITLLLGAIVTKSTLAGIGIGVACTLVLVGVMFGRFKRMKAGTLVRFSSHGVELSDPMGIHMRLRWPDITQVGVVKTQIANPKAVSAPGVGGMAVSVGALSSTGLIGWGERVVPPRLPAWVRANFATQPVNPADGRPQVAIPLGTIDPNWQQGPMGAWVRLYRPDLLPPPGAFPAQPGPSAPVYGRPAQPPHPDPWPYGQG